jgi:hypothetical protein
LLTAARIAWKPGLAHNGPPKEETVKRLAPPTLTLVSVGLAALAVFQPAPALAAPQPADPADFDRNARAFLFVLEFGLGAPLTAEQETTILTELERGWEGRPAADLKKYDAYPMLVEAIIHATDRKAVEELRLELEKSVREWLAQSDASDPAVAAIGSQLRLKGKVLLPGKPPLTVMAADAYSELYAYSELLQKDPGALPGRVSPAAVASVRARLVKVWAGFSAEEREQVASTPGLWISLRSVLRYGSEADRARVRTGLARVAAAAGSSAPGTKARTGAVGSLVKHQVLMNIQQMTFNQYLYCHGFRSSIY